MKEQLKMLEKRVESLIQEMQEIQEEIKKLCIQTERLDTMKEEASKIQQPISMQESVSSQETLAIHPDVLAFLDLDTMEERIEYLRHKIEWETITEKDLDLMAVSVDIVLKESEISDKINDLIHCVEKLAQWEINGKRR